VLIGGSELPGETAVLQSSQSATDLYSVRVHELQDGGLSIFQPGDAGIVPFVLPAKDAWTVAFFQHIMAIRFTGADNVNAMLRGEKSFDDPGIIQSAQALLDLVDAGAFDPNALAVSSDAGQTSESFDNEVEKKVDEDLGLTDDREQDA